MKDEPVAMEDDDPPPELVRVEIAEPGCDDSAESLFFFTEESGDRSSRLLPLRFEEESSEPRRLLLSSSSSSLPPTLFRGRNELELEPMPDALIGGEESAPANPKQMIHRSSTSRLLSSYDLQRET